MNKQLLYYLLAGTTIALVGCNGSSGGAATGASSVQTKYYLDPNVLRDYTKSLYAKRANALKVNNTVFPDNNSSIYLGAGVFSPTGMPLGANPLSAAFIDNVPITVGNVSQNLNFDSSVSTKDWTNSLEDNLSTKVSYGQFSASNQMDYATSSTSNSEQININYNYMVSASGSIESGVTVGMSDLSQSCQTLAANIQGVVPYAAGNGSVPFIAACGDSFISTVGYKAGVFLNLKFSFADYHTQSSFVDIMGASYGSLGSVENKLSTSSSLDTSKISISIKAFQLGGNPGMLPNIFASESANSNIINCTLNNMAPCNQVIYNALVYAGANAESINNTFNGATDLPQGSTMPAHTVLFGNQITFANGSLNPAKMHVYLADQSSSQSLLGSSPVNIEALTANSGAWSIPQMSAAESITVLSQEILSSQNFLNNYPALAGPSFNQEIASRFNTEATAINGVSDEAVAVAAPCWYPPLNDSQFNSDSYNDCSGQFAYESQIWFGYLDQNPQAVSDIENYSQGFIYSDNHTGKSVLWYLVPLGGGLFQSISKATGEIGDFYYWQTYPGVVASAIESGVPTEAFVGTLYDFGSSMNLTPQDSNRVGAFALVGFKSYSSLFNTMPMVLYSGQYHDTQQGGSASNSLERGDSIYWQQLVTGIPMSTTN